MASGKNFISSLLESKGFASVDFDKLGHIAIKNSTNRILSEFEPFAESQNISLCLEDGNLNRRALGELLFKNPELLKKQEQIVYPEITALAKAFIEEHKNQNIIFNATVLYKIPELLQLCTKIVYVTAPFLTRLKRAKKRDGIKISNLIQRFKTQKNLFYEYKKTGIPIILIKNSGSQTKLEKQLLKITE